MKYNELIKYKLSYQLKLLLKNLEELRYLDLPFIIFFFFQILYFLPSITISVVILNLNIVMCITDFSKFLKFKLSLALSFIGNWFKTCLFLFIVYIIAIIFSRIMLLFTAISLLFQRSTRVLMKTYIKIFNIE